jgi:hypothetical protein
LTQHSTLHTSHYHFADDIKFVDLKDQRYRDIGIYLCGMRMSFPKAVIMNLEQKSNVGFMCGSVDEIYVKVKIYMIDDINQLVNFIFC